MKSKLMSIDKRWLGLLLILLLVAASPLWADEEGGQRAFGFFDGWALSRIWFGAILSLIGMILLMKAKVTQLVRAISLVLITLVFTVFYMLPLGVFSSGLSLHPSPMCVTEKPFLFMNAGRGVPVIFLSILAAVTIICIIGNKLFCGWNCPLGALQELFYRIPLPKGWKIKLPFRITNSVRIGLFVLFILLLFTAGFSIYTYVNPFEFFHWGFGLIASAALAVSLIAAMFIFRPFCYLVCPLGLYTWLTEHISIVKIKVDKHKCTDCGICTELSPCPTIPAILEEKKSRPDCHPCGRCIEVCPEKALSFRK